MKLTEVRYENALPIEGYGPGFFRVGGVVQPAPLLVAPGLVQPWGGYSDTASLTALIGQVDVIFIGTGPEVAYLPEDFRTVLETAGLGVESMSSPAAARTYNVLLSESRRVAVAMFAAA
jgi:uncharacterized protein